VATSNLTYAITVINYGPALATNIFVTNTLPPDTRVVGFSTNIHAGAKVNTNTVGLVTWSIDSLAKDATATLWLTNRMPGVAGLVTSSVAVTTASADLNPDDDSANIVTTVIAPTADLALSLVDSPEPTGIDRYLIYTITVANLGVATAPGVTVVDTLPAEAKFVYAWPISSYTVEGPKVTFNNLGGVGRNQQATAIIVVQPTATGTLTNTVTCRVVDDGTGVVDPFKVNNNAGVKTIVLPRGVLPMTLTGILVRGGPAISWPASGNYILEVTRNLHPPVVWTPYTVVVPKLGYRGQMTVVPNDSSIGFFRLHYLDPPGLPLSVSRAGSNVTLAWPLNPWDAKLESATTLQATSVWTAVINPVRQDEGGPNTVTLPSGGGRQFFRLR
jgi:uncharacterized repeat protein (TIGR01451 family)